MKTDRLVYRVRQFRDAVRTPANLDTTPAKRALTDQQMKLFSRLQPSEQAHGIRVLQALETQGEKHPDLLTADLRTAALLHDIGKIIYPLRVWERVFIVLGRYWFPTQMKRWGKSQPRGWKRPFVVAAQHPLWGAELAREAGTNQLATHLIYHHQDDLSTRDTNTNEYKLLSALQEADNIN